MKPRNSALERTTSRKPRRNKPSAVVMIPIWMSRQTKSASTFYSMITHLERSHEGDCSCFQLWVFREVVRVRIHRFLNHLSD